MVEIYHFHGNIEIVEEEGYGASQILKEYWPRIKELAIELGWEEKELQVTD